MFLLFIIKKMNVEDHEKIDLKEYFKSYYDQRNKVSLYQAMTEFLNEINNKIKEIKKEEEERTRPTARIKMDTEEETEEEKKKDLNSLYLNLLNTCIKDHQELFNCITIYFDISNICNLFEDMKTKLEIVPNLIKDNYFLNYNEPNKILFHGHKDVSCDADKFYIFGDLHGDFLSMYEITGDIKDGIIVLLGDVFDPFNGNFIIETNIDDDIKYYQNLYNKIINKIYFAGNNVIIFFYYLLYLINVKNNTIIWILGNHDLDYGFLYLHFFFIFFYGLITEKIYFFSGLKFVLSPKKYYYLTHKKQIIYYNNNNLFNKINELLCKKFFTNHQVKCFYNFIFNNNGFYDKIQAYFDDNEKISQNIIPDSSVSNYEYINIDRSSNSSDKFNYNIFGHVNEKINDFILYKYFDKKINTDEYFKIIMIDKKIVEDYTAFIINDTLKNINLDCTSSFFKFNTNQKKLRNYKFNDVVDDKKILRIQNVDPNYFTQKKLSCHYCDQKCSDCYVNYMKYIQGITSHIKIYLKKNLIQKKLFEYYNHEISLLKYYNSSKQLYNKIKKNENKQTCLTEIFYKLEEKFNSMRYNSNLIIDQKFLSLNYVYFFCICKYIHIYYIVNYLNYEIDYEEINWTTFKDKKEHKLSTIIDYILIRVIYILKVPIINNLITLESKTKYYKMYYNINNVIVNIKILIENLIKNYTEKNQIQEGDINQIKEQILKIVCFFNFESKEKDYICYTEVDDVNKRKYNITVIDCIGKIKSANSFNIGTFNPNIKFINIEVESKSKSKSKSIGGSRECFDYKNFDIYMIYDIIYEFYDNIIFIKDENYYYNDGEEIKKISFEQKKYYVNNNLINMNKKEYQDIKENDDINLIKSDYNFMSRKKFEEDKRYLKIIKDFEDLYFNFIEIIKTEMETEESKQKNIYEILKELFMKNMFLNYQFYKDYLPNDMDIINQIYFSYIKSLHYIYYICCINNIKQEYENFIEKIDINNNEELIRSMEIKYRNTEQNILSILNFIMTYNDNFKTFNETIKEELINRMKIIYIPSQYKTWIYLQNEYSNNIFNVSEISHENIKYIKLLNSILEEINKKKVELQPSKRKSENEDIYMENKFEKKEINSIGSKQPEYIINDVDEVMGQEYQ